MLIFSIRAGFLMLYPVRVSASTFQIVQISHGVLSPGNRITERLTRRKVIENSADAFPYAGCVMY